MKKLSFRVRKPYFDKIVSGEKIVEYRRDSRFWQSHVWPGLPPEQQKTLDLAGDPWQGNFICGRRVHRREINLIKRVKTPENFSEQGKKDVPTPTCIAFFLGNAL